MMLRNSGLTLLLLIFFALGLSCDKEDFSYPHPSELGFRKTYEQNKTDLDKLISMIKDDVNKSDEEIFVREISQSKNISQARANEYLAIASKLSGFRNFTARKVNPDNFVVAITLYDSHEDIVTCKQGLYYSTQPIENSSTLLDSINCSSLMKKSESRRFNKITGNWYVYLEGYDNYIPH